MGVIIFVAHYNEIHEDKGQNKRLIENFRDEKDIVE